MIYCFDTSAINRLCDDVERQAIVRGVLAAHSVYITAVNCVEVLATPDPARRGQLQELLRELARGQLPLALPLDLLKVLTFAYAKGGRPGTKDLAYELSVDDYFSLDGKTTEDALQHRTNWERSFDVFAAVRPSFERVFASGASERPASFADLIRDHYRDEDFLGSLIQDLYRVTGQELPPGEVSRFLERVPEWVAVLLSLAYATYARSIQSKGFGRKRKAGAVDLWSSAYLPHCDYFVTHDFDQFKSLRFGNLLNPRRTRILRYTEFRGGLLVG